MSLRAQPHPRPPQRPGPHAYALTPNTVELIPTLGALFPRGGPVPDPAPTLRARSLLLSAARSAEVLRTKRMQPQYRGISPIRNRPSLLRPP